MILLGLDTEVDAEVLEAQRSASQKVEQETAINPKEKG